MTERNPQINYNITESLPTPDEYLRLRTVSGLTPAPPGPVPEALKRSIHCLVARTADGPESGKAIGMLRLIGDGGIFLSVNDMAVDPDYQRRGIGMALLQQMMRWIDEHAPDAYVSLVADPPGQPLYRKVGFEDTAPGLSMARSRW